MASIVRRLQVSIFLVTSGALGCIGIVEGWLTLQKVNEYCDARLVHAAVTMDQLMGLNRTGPELAQSAIPNVPVVPPTGSTQTHEVEVGYRVLTRSGQKVLASENFRHLDQASAVAPGFSGIRLDGRRWRLYRLDDSTRSLTVIVGERHDSRRDILRTVWMEHTLPLLLGLPLLGWLATWSVKRVLAPLSYLAALLARRPRGAWEPVAAAGMGAELEPLVGALNHYLLRVDQALDRETRFGADVAHELRTPIASAMLNVEGALRHPRSPVFSAALPDAIASLYALQERSEELLTLARLDDENFVPKEAVDLAALVDTVAGEAVIEAESRGVKVERSVPADAGSIKGDAAALRAMLRNLLANALRHAPRGGVVCLSLARNADACVLSVTDNGPGIPAERREAVFQRFHRDTGLGDGFGVGLSIVQRVVRLHGALVTLEDGHHGRGLRVTVRFPV
jgi:two-component system, OmpR family, sensor histidine kinase QseC